MAPSRMISYPVSEVLPEPDRILARSGCPPSRRNGLMDAVDTALSDLEDTALPVALYATFNVDHRDENRIVTGGIVFESRSLSGFMGYPSMLTVFLLTIGSGPEDRVAELQRSGEHLESFMLDAAASSMVEKMGRTFQRQLVSEYSDYSTSARFAPGFGDLYLSSQSDILKLLEGERAGVYLEENSFMLKPCKSTTGVIGWHMLEN